jgi:prepilin-type N-terminal cleavage/methylation domain-containing protein
MRRQNGFTLIEMAIAVVILLMVFTLAVPSLQGVLADKRLRRSLDNVNSLVRLAQQKSITEHRSYLIVMRDKQFAVRAEGLKRGENRAPIATLPWKKGESYGVAFPASIEEDPPAAWVFWSTGTCEPAVISYQSTDGAWVAKYSALTARAEILKYAVR